MKLRGDRGTSENAVLSPPKGTAGKAAKKSKPKRDTFAMAKDAEQQPSCSSAVTDSTPEPELVALGSPSPGLSAPPFSSNSPTLERGQSSDSSDDESDNSRHVCF